MNDPCPSRDQLMDMLNDRLNTLEVSVLDHVEACEFCQSSLQRLTDEQMPSLLRMATISTSPPPSVSFPLDRIGPYRIDREIGRGGMGVVYLGRHTRLRRPAAIKMIRTGHDATVEQVIRFRLEAEAASTVRHLNVVPVYEIGEENGTAWIALEYAPRGSLREYLTNQPMSARAAATMVAAIAQGVAAAHAQGVIHRDLKPGNILLVDGVDELNPIPKITDFGLARIMTGDRVTASGAMLGTPNYMAPEQAENDASESPGLAVDIYSLGAVLFECLTGRPPFVGPDFLAVLSQVLNTDPLSPRQLVPGIPRDLETICLKCLEKAPTRRYPTATAVADDLQRWLDGRPITAKPLGTVGRLMRSCARHPLATTLTLALFATITLGIVAAGWSWRQAVEAKATAAIERDNAQTQTAQAYLDKGLSLADSGAILPGMLWMAESLNALPANQAAIERVTRLNLAAWQPYLPRLTSMMQVTPNELPVAISPNGKRIATLEVSGNRAYVYNLETQLRLPITLEQVDISIVKFISDDRVVVYSRGSYQPLIRGLRTFDIPSNQWLYPRFMPSGKLTAWVIAGNQELNAFGTADGSIVLYNCQTNRLLRTIPVIEPGFKVTALSFYSDSRNLLAWYQNGDRREVRQIDVTSGQSVPKHFPTAASVKLAVIAPDDDLLVTYAEDHSVQMWDLQSGRSIGRSLIVEKDGKALQFSIDGRYVVIGCSGGITLWWDVATGESVSCGLSEPLDALLLGPDGRTVVTRDVVGGILRIWELPERRLPKIANIAATRIPSVWKETLGWGDSPMAEIDAETTLAISASSLGVFAWDLRTHQPRPNPLLQPNQQATAVAVSADGSRVAIGTRGIETFCSAIQLWDMHTNRCLLNEVFENWPRLLHFSPDGRLLISTGFDRFVRFWDAKTGRSLGCFMADQIPVGIRMTPDCQTLLIATRGSRNVPEVIAFDMPSFAEKLETIPAPIPMIRRWATKERAFEGTLVLSADGKRVLLNRAEGMCWLDLKTGQQVGPTASVQRVNAMAIPPNDNLIFTGGVYGTAQLWDMNTGKPKGPALIHPVAIWSVDVDIERGLAITGTIDGRVRLWDLQSGRMIGPALVHGRPVVKVRFHPREPSIISVGTDGTARTWPLPSVTEQTTIELRKEIQSRIGMRLENEHHLTPITPLEWEALRRQSSSLPSNAATKTAFLKDRLRDAEIEQAWTTAGYYLDRLKPEMSADNSAEWLLRCARCESERGLRETADIRYSQATQRVSKDQLVDWYRHRIAELIALEKWQQVWDEADRALSIQPDLWTLYASRAQAKQRLNPQSNWVVDVERAADCKADVSYLLSRGWECAQSRQWSTAARCFVEAWDQKPSPDITPHAATLLARINDIMGMTKLRDRTLPSLEWSKPSADFVDIILALTLAPMPKSVADDLANRINAWITQPVFIAYHSNLRFCRGRLLVRAERYSEAMAELRKAPPSDLRACWWMIIANHHLGNAKQAVMQMEQAQQWFKALSPSVPWMLRAEHESMAREVDSLLHPSKSP